MQRRRERQEPSMTGPMTFSPRSVTEEEEEE